MLPSRAPKIYHIVHVDRLASISADDLLCDAQVRRQRRSGTTIGMDSVKQRRLANPVKCRPGLNVGDCVPFYFCPRSIMLYVIFKKEHQSLSYRGGQEPIVHLVADLQETVDWAERNERQWAFTLSNAGSGYFDDYCDLAQLQKINREAIEARNHFHGHRSSASACTPRMRTTKPDAPLLQPHTSLPSRSGHVGTIDTRQLVMTMRFATGDILAEGAEALVNTVNCVGVMGKGIALQFKKAFPENFRAYAKACQRGEVKLGAMFVFRTGTVTNPRYIINFPTKHHWRSNSRIEAIDMGLKDLARVIRAHGIRSIALPPLGCGLGGLDWGNVRPRIEGCWAASAALMWLSLSPGAHRMMGIGWSAPMRCRR